MEIKQLKQNKAITSTISISCLTTYQDLFPDFKIKS